MDSVLLYSECFKFFNVRYPKIILSDVMRTGSFNIESYYGKYNNVDFEYVFILDYNVIQKCINIRVKNYNKTVYKKDLKCKYHNLRDAIYDINEIFNNFIFKIDSQNEENKNILLVNTLLESIVINYNKGFYFKYRLKDKAVLTFKNMNFEENKDIQFKFNDNNIKCLVKGNTIELNNNKDINDFTLKLESIIKSKHIVKDK